MSGKLLEEFNYLTLNGVYPTQYGNLGLAYVGSSIGGALPTTIESGSDPDDPIYTVDLSQEQMSYYNNLLMLSYGTKLERFLGLPLLSAVGDRFPGLKGVNFGANLKLFQVNLTGDHITQGAATGTELDIGLQGKPLPWLGLGANIQNALPFAMGGKLHYESGWDESYPAVAKLGLAIDLLGKEKALRALGSHNLKLLADMDYEIGRSDTIPPLFHLGLEWKPLPLIAIRSGIDQEMVGVSQAENNFTAGVGVYVGDFRFDYAYHAFAGAPGITNHFFSFSYGIAPIKEITDRLIVSPDKLITTEATANVKGVAIDPQIVTIKINNVKVKLDARGNFKSDVSLKIGKNSLTVEGFDKNDKLVEAEKLRILRLITYPDVASNYWTYVPISYIGTLNIIKGYPDGTFRPDGNITRAELATLLVRTKVGGDENVPTADFALFPDVPLSSWACKYVNQASTDGIVKGYPNGTFKPSANVTRAEGLTMIARFGGVTEVDYVGTEFIDVTVDHWASRTISGAYAEGMLIYLKDMPFEPNRKLTRAEAVEMLYRSKPVGALVADLIDFETGY